MSQSAHKLELRGIICSKYHSEAECARSMDWTKQKLNKITNGSKEPNVTELCELAKAIDVPVQDLALFFLRMWSPNGQQISA